MRRKTSKATRTTRKRRTRTKSRRWVPFIRASLCRRCMIDCSNCTVCLRSVAFSHDDPNSTHRSWFFCSTFCSFVAFCVFFSLDISKNKFVGLPIMFLFAANPFPINLALTGVLAKLCYCPHPIAHAYVHAVKYVFRFHWQCFVSLCSVLCFLHLWSCTDTSVFFFCMRMLFPNRPCNDSHRYLLDPAFSTRSPPQQLTMFRIMAKVSYYFARPSCSLARAHCIRCL
jgi:hypothetical protein